MCVQVKLGKRLLLIGCLLELVLALLLNLLVNPLDRAGQFIGGVFPTFAFATQTSVENMMQNVKTFLLM